MASAAKRRTLKFVKLFSISAGNGVAKGILIPLRSRCQRNRSEVNVSDHFNMIFNRKCGVNEVQKSKEK